MFCFTLQYVTYQEKRCETLLPIAETVLALDCCDAYVCMCGHHIISVVSYQQL